LTEFDCEIVGGVTLKLIPHIAVKSKVMKKVVALKDPVFLDHPKMICRDEGFQNCHGYVGVVVGAESVTYVVKKRTNDVFV